MKSKILNAWGYQGDAMNLPVADVDSAVPFYERVLGFRIAARESEPNANATLERDGLTIRLAENGGDPSQDGCAFEVDNAEAAFAEFKANGLDKEISDFAIEDNNGTKWKVFYVVAPDGLCYWFGEKLPRPPDKIMNTFPEIPLEAWRPTKNTLHLYCQIVGKIRLAMHPRLNHWWHVPLYVTPRGLSTHTIPYSAGNFEIEFDFCEHVLRIRTSDKRVEDFALYDGLTVADFYSSVFANLAKLGIEPAIKGIPYETPSTTPFAEDTENGSYDKEYIERFHQTLVSVDRILNQFRGRFVGKSTPVHMFWHSFDLALTRFSGERAPVRDGAGLVEREAYSHEVISFGFWFGDDKVPAPAFYSYTAPEPAGLADEPLEPDAARWQESNGAHLALLMYDDARKSADPSSTVLDFLESSYRAGAKRAGWDAAGLALG